MRILLIVDCYTPSTRSVAQLTSELAGEFALRGHSVTVLASHEEGGTVEVTQEADVEVVRYRTGATKGVHLVVRALREMAISLVALRRTRKVLADRSYDYLIYYSPSIFFGPLVARLKKRWGAKSYLILRDIFPDWAVDAGLMRKGVAYRLFKFFERKQYEAADVIGVETSRSVDYFRGTPFEQKVELLRNWTVAERPARVGPSAREALGLTGKVVFFYGGNMGVAQDMDNLIRLARRMASHPEAHFLFVGDGSERARLTETVEREAMANVTVHGPVDPSRYMSMLCEFDVGLITLDRRLKTFSNTGKLLGYLRCGLPILASYNPGNDLEELLEDSGAGLGSVNGEDDALYRHALELCSSSRRRVMGQKARRLLRQHFSVETIAGQVLAPVV